jgi:hypothetical protein
MPKFKSNFMNRFFGRCRASIKGKRRQSNKHASGQYQSLEHRRVLAAIFLDTAAGDLYISGGSGNDSGSFVNVAGSQFRASVNGVPDQTFSSSQVSRVFFIGGDGNDTFTNGTNVISAMYGGDGDDNFTGGSNADTLNGGRGNDTLNGGDGNDTLIGFFGNDTLNGGNGNDSIFGSADVNTIHGNAGDDIIFGGDQVDTIFGDDGIDSIFGLGGNDILHAGDGGVAYSVGVSQADLVLGLDGDDTISGGTGLNVMWGGNGNDIFIGGNGAENRMHGQSGNDELTGGDQADFLAPYEGEDTVTGGGGNDFIIAGFDDDVINGGDGFDTMRFTANYDSYRINGSTTLVVRDLRDIQPQGDDATEQVESFEFSDQTRAAAPSSVERVTVRPIVVSNTNGSNTATFFGDATTEVEIKNLVDDILAQAKVDVEWEPTVAYNNTFANVGSPATGTRPTSDLETIVDGGDAASGIGSSDPNVIDAYFVQRAAGFDTVGDNSANGLAFVDDSGTSIHIGDNLLGFQAGLEVIAGVVAHELAHNLGLEHVFGAPANLMYVRLSNSDPESTGDNFITSSQISTILSSSISRTI